MGDGMYRSTGVALEISIIMPVLNEELLIAQTLAATRQIIGDAELIVVDGGSDDRSAALARPYAHVVHARRGRAVQMCAKLICALGRCGSSACYDAGGDVCAAHV
jgi:glycosyltransferase involved in cell wall biosynthesis